MKIFIVLIMLTALLTITAAAHASVDSLWSSSASVGNKGYVGNFLYVLDSLAGVCQIYGENLSLRWSFPVNPIDSYTYVWSQLVDCTPIKGVLIYRYNISTYCYSVSLVSVADGSILKTWSGVGSSYFPKYIYPISSDYYIVIEKSTDIAGGFPSTLMVYSFNGSTAVAGQPCSTPLLSDRSLQQSYPNPADGSAMIIFSLPRKERATVTIYNQLGQEVRTLVDKELSAGEHAVPFDGRGLAAGAYFYQLRTQDGQDIRKLMLVK